MREDGMVCVTGHGVPSATIEGMEASATDFFGLPEATKRGFGTPDVYGPEGYTARGVESVARSNDQGKSKEAADVVESFTFASRTSCDRPALAGLDPLVCARAQTYWDEMIRVLDALHGITTLSFNLSRYFFEQFYRRANDASFVVRLAHYPAYNLTNGVLPYGRHTDYLTFTILRATQPGLQLEKRDGSFVDVLPVPDAFVVNAGDLTELWTNGVWRSAPHRVVPVPTDANPNVSAERCAIAFFTGPSEAAVITPILHPGDEPKFDGVAAGDWLRIKIGATTVVDDDTPDGGVLPVCDDDNAQRLSY
ncbi:hypothetical protein CTAYLR_000487 [Chrysophaeum taylorii]|uniref:Fe2OG dioxygenase domain-containing protein n=1 Tax=Chrysophaeum taylorii TaxID=2483200 RepID=A0AAD7UG07_9STRA|nr:hypothetical protein CTAYLR_000487 [Chrysophaeum taylorii]